MTQEFEISVRAHFDAAHFLPGYPGQCARLHGHRWEVEAAVSGEEPDASGILVDFMELRAWLREIVQPFDHRCLNEVPPFDRIPPTSENLARLIFRSLRERLDAEGCGARLGWVGVSESPETRVVYRET